MLPSEVPPRGNAESDTKCWTTGAFSKDNMVGCRRNLRSFPHVTRVLCAFLRRVAPGFPFSAIAFFRNQLALPHQDVNNSPSVANVIVPLTSFQEGGIWIQSQSCHEVLPGHDHLGGGRVLSLKVGKLAIPLLSLTPLRRGPTFSGLRQQLGLIMPQPPRCRICLSCSVERLV